MQDGDRDQTMGRMLDMPGFEPLKISSKASTRFLRRSTDLDRPAQKKQAVRPESAPKPKPEPVQVVIEPTSLKNR